MGQQKEEKITTGVDEEEVFLGRVEEQDRFRQALRETLREASLSERVKSWAFPKEPDRLPFLFLLYGVGGIGKTRLAARLRQIVRTEPAFHNRFTVVSIDWEKRRALDRRLIARDSVGPELVFEHIYAVFRDEGFGRQFDPYERVVKKRAETESQVSALLTSGPDEGRQRWLPLQELGAKGLAWLVRTGVPGGANIPEGPMTKTFEAIIGGGAEGLARAREVATTLLRSRLSPDEFDLFTLPNETLARELGRGIAAVADQRPVVLILDTYEIADRADVWLRVVLKRSGPRTVWVIAGRDNLADSRKFGRDYFVGYRAEFPSDRLRVLPLAEFSVEDVGHYFAHQAPERPLDDSSASAIHRGTSGIPLAVREAAAIWGRGQQLSAIVEGIPERAPREEIVKAMTERFLLHCLDDPEHPDDRSQLYTLALAYQPDADLLTAMLEVDDLDLALSDLERRHSFVFVESMKLHNAVEAFLREYLQTPVRRRVKPVREANQRAVLHLDARRRALEPSLPTLDLRIDDDRWARAVLGLVHHSLWLDEEQAWKYALSALVGGMAYDRSFARAVAQAIGVQHTLLCDIGRKRLKVLQHRFGTARDLSESHKGSIVEQESSDVLEEYFASSVSNSWHDVGRIDEQEALLDELSAAARRGWLDDGCAAERQAILLYQRGGLAYARRDYRAALGALQEAEKHLSPHMQRLPGLLADSFEGIGRRLGFDEDRYALQSPQAVLAYTRAIALGGETAVNLRQLGKVQLELRDLEASLSNQLKAVHIEPDNAHNWSSLGGSYYYLKRFDDALQAYQQAAQLDPGLSSVPLGEHGVYAALGRDRDALLTCQQGLMACENAAERAQLTCALADTLKRLGRLDEALEAYQDALELNPLHPFTHHNVGDLYLQLGRLQEAQRAFEERVRLRPRDAFSASVALAVIACHGGKADAQNAHSGRALDLWDVAWRGQLQSDAGLLEGKALALLMLGRSDQAIAVLREALACRLPGHTTDLWMYELLATGKQPPDGVDRAMAILRDAMGDSPSPTSGDPCHDD